MLSEAFTSILRSGRSEFNERFAEAKRLYPDLNAQAFSVFLRDFADPLVRAVGEAKPDRVAETAISTYDIGLQLVGKKFVGLEAKTQFVENLWEKIICPSSITVAMAPSRIIGALINAMHQIETTRGARPTQWIDEMGRYSSSCKEIPTFLQLGQICGWRAGLAHYREGALALTDTFSEDLLLSLFGAKTGQRWSDIKDRLLRDPWFNPADPNVSNSLRVVAEAGSFRGFGGLFLEPPRVTCANNQFFIRSGDECWMLTADLFGATFHRASVKEFEGAEHHVQKNENICVEGERLVVRGQSYDFPSLGAVTSVAANKNTIALTSEFTHSVVLLAMEML